MGSVGDRRRQSFRSLSSKFSMFTGVLVLWVVVVILCWDLRQHTFDVAKGIVLFGIVAIVAAAISRFTMRLLARPLQLLQAGIESVGEGRFEPIQVSRTGDEIEYLGESFNQMIAALAASQEEIRQHRELLEERIRQRTEDLERAMHTALAASQAKSEFLANMSHELRTPMNGLLGMLDVVLDSGLSPDQREQLQTAQRCAYSLLGLLNDILDLSKIEAGKMLLERIPFNARAVLADCVQSQMSKAVQKRLELTFEAAPGHFDVMGDPLRMRQILANLLSNALKFTDRGSVRVRLISALRPDGRLELHMSVSDTGSGIPADKLPEIFEKFTQADGSISRKYGGTGLGLAITRRLVEMQGGEITVESEPGRGSTFTVTIACDPAPAAGVLPVPEQASTPRESAAASESGARLLLVEDNLVNQKVVLAILRKKGYVIEVANDGREALDMLGAGRTYDLILMDVQMPVLDGLEATRTIRRDPRWQKVPIIAMTAHAMNGDRERCLQAGMDAYISKPVQPAHLISTIERHLGLRVPGVPALTNPIERVLIDRLMKEESGLVNDMVQLFLQLAPERIRRIETAALESDPATVENEARMIEAAAGQIASEGLRECARRITQAASRGEFSQVRLDLDTLRREIQSLEALTT